jgi:ribosome biogenesis GTPase A
MKKALRLIKESLPLVNLVLIVLDARIPDSSRNLELERTIKGHRCFFLLNKCDIAERQATERWLSFFKEQELPCFAISARLGSGFELLRARIEDERKSLCARRKRKGVSDERMRLMAMGIPNVGKSRVINGLSKRGSARVGRKPGVTRGPQWIGISRFVEIMDLPGIFYPSVKDDEAAWHLASVGAVKEESLPLDDVAAKIVEYLKRRGHKLFEELPISEGHDLLVHLGRTMGFLEKGDSVDLERAALHVLKSFREGHYGAFTLEMPPAREGEDQ